MPFFPFRKSKNSYTLEHNPEIPDSHRRSSYVRNSSELPIPQRPINSSQSTSNLLSIGATRIADKLEKGSSVPNLNSKQRAPLHERLLTEETTVLVPNTQQGFQHYESNQRFESVIQKVPKSDKPKAHPRKVTPPFYNEQSFTGDDDKMGCCQSKSSFDIEPTPPTIKPPKFDEPMDEGKLQPDVETGETATAAIGVPVIIVPPSIAIPSFSNKHEEPMEVESRRESSEDVEMGNNVSDEPTIYNNDEPTIYNNEIGEPTIYNNEIDEPTIYNNDELTIDNNDDTTFDNHVTVIVHDSTSNNHVVEESTNNHVAVIVEDSSGGVVVETDPNAVIDNVGSNKSKGRHAVAGFSEEVLSNKRAKKEKPAPEFYEKSFECYQLIEDALMKNELIYSGLDSKEFVNQMIKAMFYKEYPKGEVIIKEGDIGTEMYVAEKGSVDVLKEEDGVNQKVATLESGRLFGEVAIVYRTKRNATVIANSPVKLWILTGVSFKRILRDHLKKKEQNRIASLREVELLNELDDDSLAHISDLLETEEYQVDDVIIRQGDEGDKFFMISSGMVKVTKTLADGTEKDEAILGESEFFGERALIENDKRAANVIAIKPTTCRVLKKEPFKAILGSLETIRAATRKINEQLARDNQRFHSAYQHVKLEDLLPIATIGAGGFGRVSLVALIRPDAPRVPDYLQIRDPEFKYVDNRSRNRELQSFRQHVDSNAPRFALKRVTKQSVRDGGHTKHINDERILQMSCDSPFINKLYNTYVDKKYLYFLIEFSKGGDLFSHFQRAARFSNETTKFLAACAVEALGYLHIRGIIFRDLKPENLLVDHRGYIKMTDFGFAKKIGTGKTYTFSGTPEYIAPEIIRQTGHDRAADLWSLGIFIHEMLSGVTPFNSNSETARMNKILDGIMNIKHLPPQIGKDADLLIRALCHNSPRMRPGYGPRGMNEIREDKWFQGFNWATLISQTMEPPREIRPSLNGVDDLRYFSTDYTVEGAIPEDIFFDWEMDWIN